MSEPRLLLDPVSEGTHGVRPGYTLGCWVTGQVVAFQQPGAHELAEETTISVRVVSSHHPARRLARQDARHTLLHPAKGFQVALGCQRGNFLAVLRVAARIPSSRTNLLSWCDQN